MRAGRRPGPGDRRPADGGPSTGRPATGRSGRRDRGPLLLLAGLALIPVVVVLVVVGALLPSLIGRRESPAPSASPAPAAERPAGKAETDAALARAAAALRAGDRHAWAAALPSAGKPAGRELRSLFDHLAPLPWTRLRLAASPIPGHPGRYDVRAVGKLGRAGPSDRILAEAVLDFTSRGGRVVVSGDDTPPAVAGQYVMAFREPFAVSRNGLVVIADRSRRAGAEALADAGAGARERLKLLGLTSGDPVVAYYFATRGELRRALGGGPAEKRIRFFSHAPDRLSPTPAATRDIGVLGPALEGSESWTPLMLSHELTHAYTQSWFENTQHEPTLLVEGLATAVEGGRTYQPLRDDLAAAEPQLPLLEAIAAGSLWSGKPMEVVTLGYLEGGSLVQYVLDHWGLASLRRFVTAVSDSDLSREGLDKAVRTSLHVNWDDFVKGWTDYVQTLP